MTAPNKKERPVFRGLNWHRHRYYSFYIAKDWVTFSWADDREGVIYGPDPNDTQTIFAVDWRELGTPITGDDLELLAEAFFSAIEQLPDSAITERNQKVTGKLLELTAKYTFNDNGIIRKRWVRQFYHETRQIVMTAQGSTPDEYDYWLPVFFEAMMTASIHNSMPEPESADQLF